MGTSAQATEAASIPTIKDTVNRRNITACTGFLIALFQQPRTESAVRPTKHGKEHGDFALIDAILPRFETGQTKNEGGESFQISRLSDFFRKVTAIG
ncbi:hypothetical protein [Sulfitobacter sp. M13]